MDGLDLLGVVSTSLASQNINVHVKSIDADKLKSALSGSTGTFAAAGLHFVDAAPKAALDALVPVIKSTAKKYGVDADITVSTAKPPGARAYSEFWPGLLVGGIIGGSGLLIWKLASMLITRVRR